MSSSLSMSLDQAIQKRKESGPRDSKYKAKKFGFNPIRKNNSFRKSSSGFKSSKFSSQRSSVRPSFSKRFSSAKPFLKSRFIKRTRSNASSFNTQRSIPKRTTSTLKRESALSNQSTNRLKISNLDFNVTHNDIMELFSKMGTVIKNKIIYDDLGRSLGKAFVEFDKSDNAANALKEYNGVSLDGKTISVEYDTERASRKSSGVFKKTISKDISRRNFKESSRRSFRGDFERDSFRRSGGEFRRKGGDFRRREFDREGSGSYKKSFSGRPTHFRRFRKMIP